MVGSKMDPTIYTCDRCHGHVRPGDVICPHCWKKFSSKVPVDPTTYAGISRKLPKTRLEKNMGIILFVMPFLAFFDLLCFSTSRLISDEQRVQTSFSNLRNISQATKQYEADHGNKLPPTDTIGHFKAALFPYILVDKSTDKSFDEKFVQPDEGPYAVSTSLSEKPISLVGNASDVVLVRETAPHREGGFIVLYADGTVKFAANHGSQ